MLAPRLYPLRRYAPGCLLPVDIRPGGLPDFPGPGGSQYQKFEGQLGHRIGGGFPHHLQGCGNFGVGQGAVVILGLGHPGQRLQVVLSGGVVRTVAVCYGQFEHRLHSLAHSAGGLVFLRPYRGQHRHDVGRGYFVDRRRADHGPCACGKDAFPLGGVLGVAPRRAVQRNECCGRLGEGWKRGSGVAGGVLGLLLFCDPIAPGPDGLEVGNGGVPDDGKADCRVTLRARGFAACRRC